MINIGGFLRFSLLDYPGKISAVLFTQGCPLRCVYCHNPELQKIKKRTKINFKAVLDFLKTRKGLIEGVVFSGGEPLLQEHLYEAMEKVKDLGFLIGLHTSGCIYNNFVRVLPLVDWVGFDIKYSFTKYNEITQVDALSLQVLQSFNALINFNNDKVHNVLEDLQKIIQKYINMNKIIYEDIEYELINSIDYIQKTKIDFEIRTTVDTRYIKYDDLLHIAKYLNKNEVKEWTLQKCIIRNGNGNINIPFLTNEQLLGLEKYIKIKVR